MADTKCIFFLGEEKNDEIFVSFHPPSTAPPLHQGGEEDVEEATMKK